MTAIKFNAVVVGNMGLSIPSSPAFNSLLASLSSQLANAYLVTHTVRYRPGESPSRIILCLMSNSGSIRSGIRHHKRLVHHQEANCLAPR